MANFKFEGLVEELSEEQKKFVAKVLEENGYDEGTVQISLVGKAGDNFVANVKRFEIENNGKIFKMVAKIASKIPSERLMMNTQIIFNNEHVVYTEVLPKFGELEKEIGIPEEDRLKYAKCYGSLMEEPNEIILLEDLKELDLVMLNRLKPLANETVKLVLKNFAILHSLSYVLKDREPETYQNWTKKLNSLWTFLAGVPDIEKFFTQLENNILMLVNNEDHKELIKGCVKHYPDNAKAIVDEYRGSKFGVIQQGDCWTNNFMFKVEDETTTECYMIDYQLSVENSPASDIQYMIFACTDYETRAKYYLDWIDFYHEQLADRLSIFGLDVEQAYPRSQLDGDLKKYAKTYLGNDLMLTAILLKETNEAQKFKDAIQSENNIDDVIASVQVDNMQMETMARVQKKIEGVINSFIDLEYF